MNRPMPPHGDRRRYNQHACRCDQCRAAEAVYSAERRRGSAYGTWQPIVDPQAARDHVRMLLRYHTIYEIARVSGVPNHVVRRLIRNDPPSTRIRTNYATKILAVRVDLDALEPDALINACGSRRRLQALALSGWTSRMLATESGLSLKTVQEVRRGANQAVRASTARTIRDLYQRLWHIDPYTVATYGGRPLVTKTRQQASRAGWLPLAAWDNEDDPSEQPNLGEATSTDTRQVRLENFDWLVAGGVSPELAAKRVGLSLHTVADYRRRVAKQSARGEVGAAA